MVCRCLFSQVAEGVVAGYVLCCQIVQRLGFEVGDEWSKHEAV